MTYGKAGFSNKWRTSNARPYTPGQETLTRSVQGLTTAQGAFIVNATKLSLRLRRWFSEEECLL